MSHPGRAHECVRERRLRQVLLEQVHVGIKRERGLVVAEKPLHLDGVPPGPEERGSAGVPEGVEADPVVDAGRRGRGLRTGSSGWKHRAARLAQP